MDPAAAPINPGSKVRDDAVLFPVAETGGFGAFLAAEFRRESGLGGLMGPAGISLGFGPFAGFTDAGSDLFGG